MAEPKSDNPDICRSKLRQSRVSLETDCGSDSRHSVAGQYIPCRFPKTKETKPNSGWVQILTVAPPSCVLLEKLLTSLSLSFLM